MEIKAAALSLRAKNSPVKAAKACADVRNRLLEAQRKGACFVNAYMCRSRSAYLEIVSYQIEKHPLTNRGYDGITLHQNVLQLQRNGTINYGSGKLAHITWHALGRMRERSDVDIFGAGGVAGMCGVAGMIMRESRKHRNTEINMLYNNMLCTGVLRFARNDDGTVYGFFDVLTVLAPEGDGDRKIRQRVQGKLITEAAVKYVRSDNADPAGYADKIAVLPFHESDYVSRELAAPPPMK